MTTKSTLPIETLLGDTAWLRQLARHLVRDAAQADDLVQETLITAWTRPPARSDNPRGWLTVVLKNVARQTRRSEDARRRREELAPTGRSPARPTADLVERIDSARLVAKLATELDEPFRTVVLQRYYDDRSPAEIARQLGVPAGTVRWQLHEGLKRLRGRLDEEFGGDRRAWCTALLPLAGEKAWIGILGITALIRGVLTMKLFQTAASIAVAGVLWWGYSTMTVDSTPPSAATARAPAPPETVAPRPDSTADSEPARVATSADTPAVDEQTTPASRDATVALRVLDPAGRALPGVEVTVVEMPTVHTVTDTSGHAVLSSVVPEEFVPWLAQPATLNLSREGYATDRVDVKIRLGERVDLGDVVLQVAARVTGLVVDERGNPLANALVRRKPERAGTRLTPAGSGALMGLGMPHSSTSDERGRFLLDSLPPGPVTLSARLNGYDDVEVDTLELDAGETRGDVVIQMTRRPQSGNHDLVGQGLVLDGDGVPLPRASVRIVSEMGSGGHSTGTCWTDDEGRFNLRTIGHRVKSISAFDMEGRWRSVELVEPEIDQTMVLRLGEPRRIRVTAVDLNGGPIATFHAFTKQLEDNSTTHIGSDPTSATVDLMVPLHPFTVTVHADGYAEAEDGPFDPDTAPESIELRLRPLPGIAGRVLRDGEPVSGARVVARVLADNHVILDGFPTWLAPGTESEETTGDDGVFQLTVRDPKRLVVQAQLEGCAVAELGPFDYDPTIGLRNLRVDLREGGAIEGRVLVAALRSRAGVIVAASRGDGKVRTMRTGSDGTFRFDHLTPGRWWVGEADEMVDPDRVTSWGTWPGPPHEPGGDHVVREGMVTRVDLDLTRCRVRGMLRLGSLSIAGADVTLTSRGLVFGLGAASYSSRTEADGSFIVDAPAPGHYKLAIVAARGVRIEENLELVRGDQDWTFATDTAPLEITAATADFELRFERAALTGWIAITPDASGVARLEHVPLGDVDVIRRGGGEGGDPIVIEQVRIRADQPNRVDLR